MTIKQSFRHISFSIAACGVLTLSLLSSSCSEQTASENMSRLDYMAVQIDENDSWSIMDNSGKIVIEREYSPKGSVSKIYPNGLFWVRQNEKYNLFSIESYKKAINTQEYDQVTDFVDGRAFASVVGEPIVLLNEKGNVIKTLSKDICTVFYYSDGRAAFISKSGMYGYLDTNGEIALDARYFGESSFGCGFAYTISKDEKTFDIITKSGTVNASLKASKTKPRWFASEEKLGAIIDWQSENPSVTYLDCHGKEVFQTIKGFDRPEPFSGNYAVISNEKDGEKAVINEKGETVIRKGKYTDLSNFGNATFGGKKGDKYGVVDHEDNPIVRFEYDAMCTYLLGNNYLMKSGNYFTLVNPQGEEIKGSEARDISLWSSANVDFVDIKGDAELFLENIYPKGYKMFNGHADAQSIAKKIGLKLDSADLYSNQMYLNKIYDNGKLTIRTDIYFNDNIKTEKFHEETTNDGWFESTNIVSDGTEWNENASMTKLSQQINIDIKYRDNFICLIKDMLVKRGFKKDKDEGYFYAGEKDKQIRIYVEASETDEATILTYYPQGTFIYE